MKNSIQHTLRAAAAACALVTLFGCSKAAPHKAYKPLAPDGTLAACVYEIKGLADNPMMRYLLDYSLAMQEKMADVAKRLGKDIPEGVANIDPAMLKAKKEKSLDELKKFEWIAGTFAKPAFDANAIDGDGPIPLPAATLVYATTKPQTLEQCRSCLMDDFYAELDKEQADEIRALIAENVEIEKATVAGCAIEKAILKKTDKTEPLFEVLDHVKDFEPCWGVFDGTLIIFASSPKAFADTVALYKGQATPSGNAALVSDFTLGNERQMRFGLYGVASFLTDFLGEEGFSDLVPEGQPGQFLQALKDLQVSYKLDGEGMKILVDLAPTFSDENLAMSFTTMVNGAKGLLGMLLGAAAVETPAIAPAQNIFNSLAANAAGNTATISFAISKDDLEKFDFAAILEEAVAKQGLADDEDDEEEEE